MLDAVRGPLQPQYDGPFKVTKRGEENYTIKINNREVTVSMDRLKPVFVVTDDLEENTGESRDILIPIKQASAHEETSASSDRATEGNTRNRYVTRSGCRDRFPDWYQEALAKSRKLSDTKRSNFFKKITTTERYSMYVF